MSVTIFVDSTIGSRESSPLPRVIRQIGEAFGATSVSDFAMPDGIDADIVVVGSAARALHFLKETENAMVGIFVFPKAEEAPSMALVEHYPTRVRVLGWEDFVVHLTKLIAEALAKEKA